MGYLLIGMNQVLTFHEGTSASPPKAMMSVAVGDDEGCGET